METHLPDRKQDMTDTRPATNFDLVRTLIHAVDDADQATIAACTASDVHFRFGNAQPTRTQSELVAAAGSFRSGIDDMRHTILNMWEVDGGTVVATMDVYYRRLDGQELNLPCCNIFRVHDGRVEGYAIYMDVNPVIAP
jgi:ketosteroid isomerase-like protein